MGQYTRYLHHHHILQTAIILNKNVCGWRTWCYTNAHVQNECSRECVSESYMFHSRDIYLQLTILHITVKAGRFLVFKHFFSLSLTKVAGHFQTYSVYVPSALPAYQPQSLL